MAKRYFIAGLGKPATDAELKTFEDAVKAKGWKLIAQVGDSTGGKQIVFEVADDAKEMVESNMLAGGAVIPLVPTYPREEDPVLKRY